MRSSIDMRTLATRADIDSLLRDFYTRVFDDPLLGPIFVDVAHMDLDRHLPALGSFWQKVLFNTGTYDGHMMAVHRRVNALVAFTPAHYERWLEIWAETIDAGYVGTVAEAAKGHAVRIAAAMERTLCADPRKGESWP